MESITLSKKDIERFWSKVDVKAPNECWEWKGTKSEDGYGQFSCGRGVNYRPNRVSWTIHFGSIPKGMLVCHICDNRSCANPSHLFLGTPKDNMIDMAKKGRTGISLGEKHGSSKLKENDIMDIKRMLLKGISQKKIANIFGISQYAISKIKRGITWSWIK
jgi:hypothetical protein